MQERIHDIIFQLQQPVSDLPTLLNLLAAPLDALRLLPARSRQHLRNPLASTSTKDDNLNQVFKQLPTIQRLLLTQILPVWEQQIHDDPETFILVDQYFCPTFTPDTLDPNGAAKGEVARLAYGTLLSTLSGGDKTNFRLVLRLLGQLTRQYAVDKIFLAIFTTETYGRSGRVSGEQREVDWEEHVKNIMALPAKVSNVLFSSHVNETMPDDLEHGAYFNKLAREVEHLVNVLCNASYAVNPRLITLLTYLFSKMQLLGLFPPTIPSTRSQPSFFQTTLPTIRSRLTTQDAHSSAYSNLWTATLSSISSSLGLRGVLTSLFSTLEVPADDSLSLDASTSASVKREALLLTQLIGTMNDVKDGGQLREVVTGITLTERGWSYGLARVTVCWIGRSESGWNELALTQLLQSVVDIWSSPEHIQHSLLAHHQFLTFLLLLTLSQFPTLPCERSSTLAFSPFFVQAIGVYISHMDPFVRRCGMLVAEIVAQRAGKTLDFKDWEGDDGGRDWARRVRSFITSGQRDIDADLSVLGENPPRRANDSAFEESTLPDANAEEDPTLSPQRKTLGSGYDSDDSIAGYASTPSSRSASPTPSELAEVEADPTIGVGVKKVSRPVYLAQLGDLLRGSTGFIIATNKAGGPGSGQQEAHDADKIEMALACAEQLIRRRKNFGSELEENAVNLVYGFLGLQNNFDLDGFDQNRQNALVALVACCPQKAAPALAEEFFKNQYSAAQRFVALNALALGARELASLPNPTTPATANTKDQSTFPSKMLPPSLHQKYLTLGGQSTLDNPLNDVVPAIMDNLSREALDHDKSTPPLPVSKTRRFRVTPSSSVQKIVELGSQANTNATPATNPSAPTYATIATSAFLAPLISSFWLFLRDSQTRESRTAHLSGPSRYHGAGTGLILNPLVLAHFLSTLGVLVSAAAIGRAPEWIGWISGEALEVAVVLGTKPISYMEEEGLDDEEEGGLPGGGIGNEQSKSRPREKRGGKDASVLSAALELALVVLDGSMEVDGGRSLGLEHTALLLGAGEWAGVVLSGLEKGAKVIGGGGKQEYKLQRAAAGVLLKVDEISRRWGRSMVDLM